MEMFNMNKKKGLSNFLNKISTLGYLCVLLVFPGLSEFPKVLTTAPSAGTTYYVSRQGNNKDGLTWETAWNELNQINWSVINPGDTIEIDGGAYNTTLTVGKSGSSGNPITIMRSNDKGHDGDVLLQGNGGYGISIRSYDYITISGLKFTGWQRAIYISGSSGTTYSENGAAKYITIKNCEFQFDGGNGVFIQTSDHISVVNNTMYTSNYSTRQTDGIYSQRNHENTYGWNNIVINNTDANGHDDCIQMYQDTDISVIGNYAEQNNSKRGNAQGIYAEVMYGTSYFINNVVNLRNAQSNALTFMNLEGNGTAELYGNTVYGIRPFHLIWITETPNPVVKNNIGMVSTTTLEPLEITSWAGDKTNIANNLLYNPNTTRVANIGGPKTQSALETSGINLGGLRANPDFVSIDNQNFHLNKSSPAIDAGKNLLSIYNTDKDGISRPQGYNFDIGAYEYDQDTSPPPPSPAPSISKISPNQGSTLGGFQIDVTGNYFQSGAKVMIRESACQNIQVKNAGLISCTIPPNSAGKVDVIIKNPDGQSATVRGGFTYIDYSLTQQQIFLPLVTKVIDSLRILSK